MGVEPVGTLRWRICRDVAFGIAAAGLIIEILNALKVEASGIILMAAALALVACLALSVLTERKPT